MRKKIFFIGLGIAVAVAGVIQLHVFRSGSAEAVGPCAYLKLTYPIGFTDTPLFVPPGCTRMKVKLWGGGGNSGFTGVFGPGHPPGGYTSAHTGAGGGGGFTYVIYNVTPTDEYRVISKGRSTSALSGGELTAVVVGPTPSPGIEPVYIAIAGGGGGGGMQSPGYTELGDGGSGGGVNGGTGDLGGTQTIWGAGGGGGLDVWPGNPNGYSGPAGCAGFPPYTNIPGTPQHFGGGYFGEPGGCNPALGGFGSPGMGGNGWWGGASGGYGDGQQPSGGGGGGGSGYIRGTSADFDIMTGRGWNGDGRESGGDGDPDYSYPGGMGAAGGTSVTTAAQWTGKFGMATVTYGEDMTTAEGDGLPVGWGSSHTATTCGEVTSITPTIYPYPGTLPPSCNNPNMQCRHDFYDPNGVICKYRCHPIQQQGKGEFPSTFKVSCP